MAAIAIEQRPAVELANISNRKNLRLRQEADLEARRRRLEDAQNKPIVARAEPSDGTGHRNRLCTGMHGPDDLAGQFGANLVLNDHLSTDQCRSTPNGARRLSVGRRQIENCPFAVPIDAIADHRRVRVGYLVAIIDYRGVVAGGLRPIVPPARS